MIHISQIDSVKRATLTAGIHTVELKSSKMQYIQPMPAYLRSIGKTSDGFKLMINPHRNDTVISGRFKTLYGDRAAIEAVVTRAVKELQLADDWHYSRIDLAIDMDCPYEQTDKITRLLLLMLSVQNGLDNRYMSVEPYTGALKTMRVGDEKHNTLKQIEHYNRALVDQTAYDTCVINRLEFRLGGLALTNINAHKDMRPAIEKWREILDKSITPEALANVEYQAARVLFDEWRIVKTSGSMKQLAQYIRAHGNRVYTRNQLKHLYDFELSDVDKASKAAKNLWSDNKALRSELYTLDDLREYRDAIWLAVRDYLKG